MAVLDRHETMATAFTVLSRTDRSVKNGDKPDRREADDRKRRSGPVSRLGSYFGRPSAEGRSGYGSESVRPYLRAQLRLKELLNPHLSAQQELEPLRIKSR